MPPLSPRNPDARAAAPPDRGAGVTLPRVVAWMAVLAAVALVLAIMDLARDGVVPDRWTAVLHVVTTLRLDTVLFALTSIAGLGMAISWAQRRGGAVRGRAGTWIALTGLVAFGGLAAEWAARRECDDLRERLQGLAPTYAEELARLGHADLALDAAADDPLYLALIDAQKRWLAVNPLVSDIYTFRSLEDAGVVLVVDSETDYDRDGAFDDEREHRTAIGEPYDTGETAPDDALMLAFAGQTTFDDVPYTDRWGTWVSAYAPMRDGDGVVEAVLGVDCAARGWVSSIAWSRAAALGFTSIVIVILIGYAASMSLVRAELARRVETETMLRRAATHDRLTGLPNRALLMSRLNSVLRGGVRPSRQPSAFVVLFLDFDRFKFINDTLGHEAGDRLLTSIADRLCEVCEAWNHQQGRGTEAMCARIGGDEFVLLASGLSDPGAAVPLTRMVQKALVQPHWVREQEVRSTPSIGVTTSAHDYTRAEDVLRDADLAMYQAKAAGRNCMAMFDASMREAAMARMTIENDLRRAVDQRELTLVYQPIVSLENGRPMAVEALARWKSPLHGIITPGEFIGVAEEAGLMLPLGEHVLRLALLQSVAWKAAGGITADLSICVNLSRVQLQSDDLLRSVERLLWETGADPSRFVFEVTENAIMDNPQSAARAISALRSLGFRVHMDDFGTGHSSLSLLHGFQLDGIKIDRSFIATVCERRDYAAIVHAVVGLAHKLNMKLVAEGIETGPQMAMLQALTCDFGQGYFFARPVEADAVPTDVAAIEQRNRDNQPPQARAA